MERDLTKPVFYIVPFAWLDNLMPARKGEEAMQAIVKEHQARIDDNSYPVFYVVPKPLITSVFPKYKDANSQSSAPPALFRGRWWLWVMVFSLCRSLQRLPLFCRLHFPGLGRDPRRVGRRGGGAPDARRPTR